MDNFRSIPIHRLVESDLHLVELMVYLARGGDPNLRVGGGRTLLHEATQSYQFNAVVVQELINSGADVESTTKVGCTPLHFAVMSRNRRAVEALIQAGARTNARNRFGRTALHYAINSCQPPHRLPGVRRVVRNVPDLSILKTLLGHQGTDVNAMDSKGETPLVWAVKHGSLVAVEKLLAFGANPNISNQQAQNALHVALSARNPDIDIVIELLKYGAGVYDVDHLGRTPVDILLQDYLSDSTLFDVMECLALIVFKYRIRGSLERKIRQFPRFVEFFRVSRKEVEYMNRRIIYDRVNLHDFVSGCFQERVGNLTLEVHIPVVRILLTKEFPVYLLHILFTISARGLFDIVRRIIPPSYVALNAMNAAVTSDLPHLGLFSLIMDYA